MRTMKMYISILLMIIGLISCTEDVHAPLESDGSIPADVSNVKYTPINGGFDITYDLPKDKNVLYVKALYTNNKGEKAEVRTSTFRNKIKILGYGDSNEKTVKLVTVTRSNVESSGTSFSGIPLIPVVDLIAETVIMAPHFGGPRIWWVNKTETPVTVEIFAENEKQELEVFETIYSKELERRFTLRNREPIAQSFKVVIRDGYGNISKSVYPDTPDKKITPLLENLLEKGRFSEVRLDNDLKWDAYGSKLSNLWDENPNPENWAHTEDAPRPALLTIDLGVIVKLSRMRLHQRGNDWGFRHANPKNYTIYGSLTIPGQNGKLDNWIKLGEFESIKPSGLPVGQLSDEDRAAIISGEDNEFETLIPIRYIRIAVTRTWGGSPANHIRELTFWGQIQ